MANEKDASWFAARLPPAELLDEILGDDPVTALLAEVRTRAPVELGVDASTLSEEERKKVEQELALAASAAKKLKEYQSLAPTEIKALDVLDHLVARPSLRIVGNQLPEVPASWPALHTARLMVLDVAPSIGRIDTHARAATGTGWFAAPGLLLTNAHVVAQLCGIKVHEHPETWHAKVLDAWEDQNKIWAKQPAKRPVWESADVPGTAAEPARIPRIRQVHDTYDMALLEIEGLAEEPDPLTLSLTPPPDLNKQPVYVIGYPSLDGHSMDSALAKLLFGATLKGAVKRVAPGYVREVHDADARHDASTLGGSSGSPVIDLAEHRVHVLHALGSYGISNQGVALWKVKDEPFFADHGVRFGDA